MTLEDTEKTIIEYVKAMRAAQKMRQAATNDSAVTVAKNLEFLARRKLFELADLHDYKLARMSEALSVAALEKER